MEKSGHNMEVEIALSVFNLILRTIAAFDASRVLDEILSFLNDLILNHTGLVIAIGCAASLFSAFMMARVSRRQSKTKENVERLSMSVKHVEDIVDNKFSEFSSTLLDGFMGIKELREKLESFRGE